VESARKARKLSKAAAKPTPVFDAQRFLDSAGVSKTIAKYSRGDAVFTQGDACDHVM